MSGHTTRILHTKTRFVNFGISVYLTLYSPPVIIGRQIFLRRKVTVTKKWVYLSKSAKEDLAKTLGHEPDLLTRKIILGGKGAGLAEMTSTGVPVPPSFTITTEACVEYMKTGDFPEGMWEQTLEALAELEKDTGRTFGDPANPLLVSVRSGARDSMPGMMDTVLNLGLNDETRVGLARRADNEWFSYDAYRRFITMFSDIVMDYSREHFEHKLRELKSKEGVHDDPDVSLGGLKALVDEYKRMYKEHFGEDFPTDPHTQLKLSIKAVFDSWNGARAIAYRDYNHIPHDWGTAVNVCTMVFGNFGENSGTGVAFSRDPATGEAVMYGEYLQNAQGEDVVAGIRTPKKIAELKNDMPVIYEQFAAIATQLEQHYRDMQDMEFTVEKGNLWMLQTRNGKRTAAAAVKVAVDLVREGLITKEEAVMRVKPSEVDQLLHPFFDPTEKKRASDRGDLIAKGLNASPGAGTGMVVFEAAKAQQMAAEGKAVILVRPETSPDDVAGMLASAGVLTQHGGMTSHAAVVARGNNLPGVVGCEGIDVNVGRRQFTVKETGYVFKEGTVISIDGGTGEVFLGVIPTLEVEYQKQENLVTLLEWADAIRVLGVRTNADDGPAARTARIFGAEGIGLCRTEHMFFNPKARDAVVSMIMAKTPEARQAALEEMLPFQEQDFEEVFEAMDGLPVIMRLIDPPMHEFLPSKEELIEAIYELKLKILTQSPTFKELDELRAELEQKEEMLRAVISLWEVNPMMGLRGCRAGIMYKGLTEMQTRAYFQAACRCAKRDVKVKPEVMIPLVGHVNELKLEREKLEAVAKQVMEEEGIEVEYMFGTMIEVPRAALTAGEVAQYADFFSFGTNDLTQMTFGYSRDDAEGKFLLTYIDGIDIGEKDLDGNPLKFKILPVNPFESLDQTGVGRLVKLCVEEGKVANPTIEVGICGEHGGDPASIDFCHRVGLDYVSCSPYRVPVARLAAAQAAIRNR
ncbi:MAG: pyruvate, phosphate dikinase [Anaerolineae bacterium]|nr:pyruvate, phosphate dikinase [Anaerolineae bacterium]